MQVKWLVHPLFLAWCAARLEAALVLCFLTGAFFRPAALIAAAYVLFLGFSFHGPATGPATRPSSASSSTIFRSWPDCCSRRCMGRDGCFR